jgi:hypothetical protein
MDVDLAEISNGQLSEPERKRLQAEGRCFFCKNQGHMARQCPKKGRPRTEGQHPRPRPTIARTVDADEETLVDIAAISIPNRQAVLKGIQGMNAEERGKLLDELIMTEQTEQPSF